MLWSTLFWRGALERAIKTFFQTFVAVLIAGVGAETVGISAGILEADWLTALSVAALATVLSVATSIGNADFTAGQTPVVIEHVAPTERTVDLDAPRPADVAYDDWDSMRNQR